MPSRIFNISKIMNPCETGVARRVRNLCRYCSTAPPTRPNFRASRLHERCRPPPVCRRINAPLFPFVKSFSSLLGDLFKRMREPALNDRFSKVVISERLAIMLFDIGICGRELGNCSGQISYRAGIHPARNDRVRGKFRANSFVAYLLCSSIQPSTAPGRAMLSGPSTGTALSPFAR